MSIQFVNCLIQNGTKLRIFSCMNSKQTGVFVIIAIIVPHTHAHRIACVISFHMLCSQPHQMDGGRVKCKIPTFLLIPICTMSKIRTPMRNIPLEQHMHTENDSNLLKFYSKYSIEINNIHVDTFRYM